MQILCIYIRDWNICGHWDPQTFRDQFPKIPGGGYTQNDYNPAL